MPTRSSRSWPRRSRRAFDQFEADLAARGCAALAYKLSGDLLDHLCVVHLIGALRVIVAFESAEVVYVILVGNHDDSRPPLDVYRQLYAAAGHEPLDQAGRDKPPCCDTETGKPPVDPRLLDELLARMRRFKASDVRSAPGGGAAYDNIILPDRVIAEPHKPGQVVGSAQTSARPR